MEHDIGRAFKVARAIRGVTQRDLAKAVGCSLTFISLIERGERDPSWSSILAVARAVDLAPHVLVKMATDGDAIPGIASEVISGKEI